MNHETDCPWCGSEARERHPLDSDHTSTWECGTRHTEPPLGDPFTSRAAACVLSEAAAEIESDITRDHYIAALEQRVILSHGPAGVVACRRVSGVFDADLPACPFVERELTGRD